MAQKNSEKFEQLGTKIDPAMAEVLNAVCDSLQVDVYHLLQWFAYTVIRYASPQHRLDPRIQKIMAMLDVDAGWQTAFNLANPDDLQVSQVILILEQKKHKGFGAVMIDKPFMGEARQTECVDDILERVTEVTMSGIYKRIRELGATMQCQHLSDILLTMLDAQTIIELEDGMRAELPQLGDRAMNGKEYAYGKRTKAKQRRTPDSVAKDNRIKWTDDDYELADMEAGTYRDLGEEVDEALGCRPFGYES